MNKLFLHLLTPIARLYKTWDTWYTKRKNDQAWDTVFQKELNARPLVDNKVADWYKQLLTNQMTYLRQQEVFDKQHNSSSLRFTFSTAAAIIRDYDVVRPIVGIQPMTGPVGSVFSLSYTYGDEVPDGGRRMKLEVIKNTIEAGTRRLAARYSMEAAQDVSAHHELNVEEEIKKVLASEVTHEVVAEVIADLKKLASQNEDHGTDVIKLPSRDHLILEINKAANRIGHTTRRGAGNFIVASPITIAELQSSTFNAFVPAETPAKFGPLTFKGTLNGTIAVYASLTIDIDEVLIGYKGKSGECDTGYFYCPYVALMPTGVMIDPNTFQPIIGMMTRYGKSIIKPSDKSLTDSIKYYRTFKYEITPELPETVIVEDTADVVENND